MRKKTVRYNKGYSLSLAMAALLVLNNAETVSAQEEENVATTPETALETEAAPVEAAEKAAAKAVDNIELSPQTIHMTEGGTVVIEAEVGPDTTVEDLTWTYNGAPIAEAKQWRIESGAFDGDQFITFVQEPTITDGVLHAELKFGLLFSTHDLEKRDSDPAKNLRRVFPKYIGDYPLVITNNKEGQQISKNIHMFPYEHYLEFEDIVEKTDKITEEAQEKTDRVVKIEQYGESEQGRPQRVGIVAKSQETIDHYLNVTHPKMLKSPDELIELIKKGEFKDPVAVMVHNTHADEKPAPEVVVGAFEKFALGDVLKFETTDNDGNVRTVEYKISDMLDRLIFLFSFVENPDGHFENKREDPPTGLDYNRDHGYQVLKGTQNVVELINKWDPVSFFDIHGFMKPSLIEPCTKPHDKNFEADILYPILTEQAYAIGNALAHNSDYTFEIPLEDFEDGWDDAFSGYTGVYALYQGIFGHTFEIPEMNESSYLAALFGVQGGLGYVYENLDDLLLAKLGIFSRGIHKVDDPEVNDWLVDKNGNGARPENFFPDYYIIPLSKDQRNVKGAFDMIAYLRRNGVEVHELTKDVGGYKKGDLIINMAQAKRGFANHVLSMGFDESVYNGMYAELVVNFPILRGFDAYRILLDGEEDVFAGNFGEVTHTSAPIHTPEEESKFYFVKNNSKEAILAITEAINNGAKVFAGKDGYYIDHATYQTLKDKYAISVSEVKGTVDGQTLQPVKVFTPESAPNYAGIVYPSQTESVLKELGFNLVDSADEADFVVMDSDNFDAKYLGKKPTIVLGGWSALQLGDLIEGLEVDFTRLSHEGLLKVDVDKDSLLSSGYDLEDYLYTNEGTWIEKLPEGFKALITVKDSEDFFVSGWWPGHENAQGKIMAAVGEYEGIPLFIYAGTPTNKFHPQALYRWLTNALYFQGVEEATVTPDAETPTPTPDPGQKPGTEKPGAEKPGKEDPTDPANKGNVTQAGVLPSTGAETGFLAAGLASLFGGFTALFAADDKKRKAARK